MRLFKICMITVLIFSILTISGCTRQDWMDLLDIAKMWARENGYLDEKDKPNYTGIGAKVLFGDEEAKAVLDAGMTVKNFQEAEKLSEEGWKSNDVKKIDSAISMRPGEFRYNNQRGAILFFDGKYEEANREFETADSKLLENYNNNFSAQIQNCDSRISCLKEKHSQLESTGSLNIEQEMNYYNTLSKTYLKKWGFTNDEKDKHLYEAYKNEYDILWLNPPGDIKTGS